MDLILSEELKKNWEKEFYQNYGIKLVYSLFSCNDPLISYFFILDSGGFDTGRKNEFLTKVILRFSVRVKPSEDPLIHFSKILFFFERYGIIKTSLESSSQREIKTEKGATLIVQDFQFELSELFILKSTPPKKTGE